MLGIALAGLFLRPFAERHIAHAVNLAFAASLVIVGLNLTFPIDLLLAATIAVGAVIAQMIVAPLLAWSVDGRDKIFLAFAQQNGITALILALYFAPHIESVVPVVAAAVFAINVFHLAVFPPLGRRRNPPVGEELAGESQQARVD